ncbi:hypothetical protein NHQ30_010773 [Ciborinia camelliae]|nr:hypothetical protein NHQ30_010773 [Ciborinia camelliae]
MLTNSENYQSEPTHMSAINPINFPNTPAPLSGLDYKPSDFGPAVSGLPQFIRQPPLVSRPSKPDATHGENNLSNEPKTPNRNLTRKQVDSLRSWIRKPPKSRSRFKSTASNPLVDNEIPRPANSSSSASSTADKRKRLALLRQDPLNVHQKALKYLQGTTRRPITSAYDVARLVVDSCINLFDQYQVPDEFQFFDFFERSIGAVVSETQLFPYI